MPAPSVHNTSVFSCGGNMGPIQSLVPPAKGRSVTMPVPCILPTAVFVKNGGNDGWAFSMSLKHASLPEVSIGDAWNIVDGNGHNRDGVSFDVSQGAWDEHSLEGG